ncbi:hypothetical protein BDV95DRAFT_558355 [Massariosphaeria phaeospora]|uniref:Myb-like domain-containing protein n=1 Tax=Massariosphaeria phaeospora TaxID=100035 RepID=A0A7C8IDP6_9PLEO|nr:hypothetical protein BDV95DRAFT_558355 [Massariosphaeria phaeospora]
MEPRIARLLGDASSASSRTSLDAIALLPLPPPPPASVAPRKPEPALAPGSDDARAGTAPQIEYEYAASDHYAGARPQPPPLASRQKTSVPLAEVLNDDAGTPTGPQFLPAFSTAPAPFSGRLADILLDPFQQHSTKRRKLDGHTTPPALTGGENSLLKLPKLPQLPKKSARRPRIPPLLQGLHQPPPLPPEGRLFPPITSEGAGFGRDIGDRPNLRSPGGLEVNKEKAYAHENVAAAVGVPTNGETGGAENGTGRRRNKGNSTPVPVNEKENRGQIRPSQPSQTQATKTKEYRRRNKWSEQETKDLLVGVSMYGIGNWKRILKCKDFAFNQRTAVDLKDRFRTCCPGEGLKLRKPRSGATSGGGEPSPEHRSSHDPAETAPIQKIHKPRGNSHKKGPVELAKMGIQGPFTKNTRRERHEFTETDDVNLISGYYKHGPIWHLIRSDADLGFHDRQPTDLRDRFRIRYPDLYAKAGYKVKPKDEALLKEQEEKEQEEKEQEHAQNPEPLGDPSASHDSTTSSGADAASLAATTSTSTSMSAATASTLHPHALRQPLNAFTTGFDFSDMFSEEDVESGRSPIILNRNIFQWADAHPSQATGSTASMLPTTNITTNNNNMPPASSFGADVSMNLLIDSIHTNPLASSLELPPGAPMFSTAPAYSSSTNPNPNMFAFTTATAPTPTAPVSTAVAPTYTYTTVPPPSTSTSTSAKQTVDSLLRTPNLPTILFPHVPVASARSAMHNLPPPTDLLSGLDGDVRADAAPPPGSAPHPAVGPFIVDDGFGFGVAVSGTAAATLAPMLGSGGGSGSGNGAMGGVGAGRGWWSGLLEEQVGERR